MPKIYKQRRTAPYHANGKTKFNIQNRSGVYMIYKNDELRYIGFSGTNLYKTLYLHFQSWEDKNQIRVTYKRLSGITVRVIYTNTSAQAMNLERALIVKLKPKDNPNKYEEYVLKPADNEKLNEYYKATTKAIAQYEGDVPF